MKEQEDARILLCCSLLVMYQYIAVDLNSERKKIMTEKIPTRKIQVFENMVRRFPENGDFTWCPRLLP